MIHRAWVNSDLLHLSSILSTQDDHLLLGEVDGHRGRRGHASGESVRRERAGVVDDIVGTEVLKLFAVGTNEHVAHEESMVSTRADNTNVDPVTLVPSCVAIDNVDAVARVEVVDCSLAVDTPDLRTQSHVSTGAVAMG